MALCLSGGGFRAALFHLGAARCLNDHGVLSQLDTITCVSGGSIFGAHLAAAINPWPPSGATLPDWEEQIAEPFRKFAGRDLRTWPILCRYLPPWNALIQGKQSAVLAHAYEHRLTRMRVHELPQRPRFVFCATDMIFGTNWIFERERVGDFVAGYCSPGDLTVGQAIAASSCFPPIFQPMPIPADITSALKGGRFPHGAERDRLTKGLCVTDGGVYDNMGLEPAWKDHQVLLVSDGGAAFLFQLDRTMLRRLLRYNGIIGDQAGKVRRRWLMSMFFDERIAGAFWSVSSAVDNYDSGASGYSTSFAKNVIARIRTDMDSFSIGEAKVLENHGYTLADVALRRHASHLLVNGNPLQPPHPEWMNESRAAEALRNSHRRRWLGRRS
jgi:NTE family protein